MKIPLAFSWSKCVLITAVLLLAALRSHGQKPLELDLMIEFSTVFDHAQEKFIHEGIRDQDPVALVWIDVAAQQVLVRMHSELDRVQLQAVIAAAGLHITYLGPPRIEADGLKSLSGNVNSAVPIYHDSGDPASDNARYELEKKAWIEARPELYQQQLEVPAPEQ